MFLIDVAGNIVLVPDWNEKQIYGRVAFYEENMVAAFDVLKPLPSGSSSTLLVKRLSSIEEEPVFIDAAN